MNAFLQRLRRLLPRRLRPVAIPEPLWHHTLQRYPFLGQLDAPQQARLRELCQDFMARKEFTGAGGLRVSDEMALAVAAQACLPLLHWGRDALDWYDDFVGVVLHPGPVLARRVLTDAAGVVHHHREALAGEAMAGGPVMLNWQDVRDAAHEASQGRNLVIHEFAHKIDMHGHSIHDEVLGCPLLPPGFLGLSSVQARRHWRTVWGEALDAMVERVSLAERFGAEPPWLDAYAATGPGEMFAVACEAHFVAQARFAAEWPELERLLQAFFNPAAQARDD